MSRLVRLARENVPGRYVETSVTPDGRMTVSVGGMLQRPKAKMTQRNGFAVGLTRPPCTLVTLFAGAAATSARASPR
jgi:hypothetical protein